MAMNERLFSLDLLRGLDMFLLRVVGPFIYACHRVWHFSPGFMRQFDHAWGVFSLWDIIMPLFIFICGAAVPLALPKRMENGRAGWKFWRHVFSRIALLWFLGLICQGNLLSLDTAKIALYTNTLQAIAAGYFVAALSLLVKNARVRFALPFVLVFIYAMALAVGGDYSRTGNFAYLFEQKLEMICPWIGNTLGGYYTWFLTSFMFGAMTLFGLQSTEILRMNRPQKTKALLLAGYGAALLALGWILVPVIPSIKQIYTASFTLQAMGWSMLAYAALYVVTDIWKVRRGFGILTLYGQCALFVYMLGGVFSGALYAVAETLTQGVPHLLSDAKVMPVVVNVVSPVLLTLVTYYYRKAKMKV